MEDSMKAINLKEVFREANLNIDKLRKHPRRAFEIECATSAGKVRIHTPEEKVVLGLLSIEERDRNALVKALLDQALANGNAIQVYEGKWNPYGRRMTVAVSSNTAPYEMHLY